MTDCHPCSDAGFISSVQGFEGLTQRPTAHRYRLAERSLYTWCATDTLLFTVILGLPAVAESTCPATGAPIRVELRPDAVVSADPPGAVVTQRISHGRIADLRADVCHLGHFYASHDAAEAWAEHPDVTVLPLAEAFAQARKTCEQLGWAATSLSAR